MYSIWQYISLQHLYWFVLEKEWIYRSVFITVCYQHVYCYVHYITHFTLCTSLCHYNYVCSASLHIHTYIHQVATYLVRKTSKVRNTSLRLKIGGPEKDLKFGVDMIYLELVYLVTALVPSETACLASSPGRRSLTAVWISREVMVERLL